MKARLWIRKQFGYSTSKHHRKVSVAFLPEVWSSRGITDANSVAIKRKYYNQRLADPGEDQYSQLSKSDHFVNHRFVSQLYTVSRALS